MKTKIFIFSNFYKPGFLAGGPIQSVHNLSNLMANDLNIYIYTQNFDFNQKQYPYKITKDQWIKQENFSNVCYQNQFKYHFASWIQLFKVKPDVIYLNSLFSIATHTNLIQAIIYALFYRCKIIIAPRGELEQGALSIKPLKKKLFIAIFRTLNQFKLYFHATTPQEAEDIKQKLATTKVILAHNVPQKMIENHQKAKEEMNSNFVFVSRISPKKNLLFALQCFHKLQIIGEIQFSIIGPFEDGIYWKQCETLISKLPKNISCKILGPLQHNAIIEALKNNHFMFFPTLGENYGHVIYEALSNGLPVLISNQTPWENNQKNAIFAHSLTDEIKFIETLTKLHALNNNDFSILSQNAFTFAQKHVDFDKLKTQYKQLFE